MAPLFDISGSLPGQEQRALAVWYAVSVALFLLTGAGMLLVSAHVLYSSLFLKSEVSILTDSLEALTTQYTALAEEQAKYTRYSTRRLAVEQHSSFIALLVCLAQSLPEGVRFDELFFDHNALRITGSAQSLALCTSFLKSLKQSTCFNGTVVQTITRDSTHSNRHCTFVVSCALSVQQAERL